VILGKLMANLSRDNASFYGKRDSEKESNERLVKHIASVTVALYSEDIIFLRTRGISLANRLLSEKRTTIPSTKSTQLYGVKENGT